MIFRGELVAADRIAEAVTQAWNTRHLYLQQVENTGIGLGEPALLHSTTWKMLRKRDIDITLTYRDAEPWSSAKLEKTSYNC
jgi:hypothetical protein